LRIVGFYQGTNTDSEGRLLPEILAWNFDQLEFVHDYIQWLFPLRERSMFNPDAPVLDDRQRDAFRKNEELQAAVLLSFRLMLSFYGFDLEEGDPPRVVQSANFPDRSANWLTSGNHNFLRITRILKSLRLMGLEQYAKAFFAALEGIYQTSAMTIGAGSFQYWKQAVTAPLD
jgi:hypothetical protein